MLVALTCGGCLFVRFVFAHGPAPCRVVCQETYLNTILGPAGAVVGHGRGKGASSSGPRWKRTIYRGVLHWQGRYRCRLFGQYCGRAKSLEDAVALLLERFQTHGLTREDLLRRGRLCAKKQAAPTPPKLRLTRKCPQLLAAVDVEVVRGLDRQRVASQLRRTCLNQCVRPPMPGRWPAWLNTCLGSLVCYVGAGLPRQGCTHLRALTAPVLVQHFRAWWSVYSHPDLVPHDLRHTAQSLASSQLLAEHGSLLVVFVGLKYAVWRDALVAAAAEAGLSGKVDDPHVTPTLLLQILRATVCRMDGVAIPQLWSRNVGRGNSHHSGGIVWLRHLMVVQKVCGGSGCTLKIGAGGLCANGDVHGSPCVLRVVSLLLHLLVGCVLLEAPCGNLLLLRKTSCARWGRSAVLAIVCTRCCTACVVLGSPGNGHLFFLRPPPPLRCSGTAPWL
jgi:hypothetical protein